MKKALSILLTIFCAFGLYAGTIGATSPEVAVASAEETSAETTPVDYAGQAVLDFDADSETMELEVKMFIDGDTTHFWCDGWGTDNIFKARYAAVNTPESTGKIEPWGKKAANFTRSKLENAASIVIESDGDDWAPDSTGDRYLSWVWYKAKDSDTYRNLNLELLQNGLAVGSKAGDSRYGTLANAAINQATQAKLHVFSQDKDPDFFYGESIEIDLKELRLNIDYYEGKRVAFEGVVSAYSNNGVYVENYDAETDMYYGIYAFYAYNFPGGGLNILSVGNKVRITGVVGQFNGTYQLSSLEYNPYKPTDKDIRLIEKGHSAANVETTAAEFTGSVPVTYNKIDPETEASEEITKNIKYSKLAENTSISMKNLYVKSAYTTNNGGDNDGAMTLTCQSDGKTIKVRTVVLRNSATGELATQDMLVGKMIDVTGIVECFDGTYQIKVLHSGAIKVNGDPLFPPVVVEPTPDPAPSDTEESGCGSTVAISAILPMLATAAFVLLKKREN